MKFSLEFHIVMKFIGALLLFWLLTGLLWQNGISPENYIWQFVSGTRWLLTIIGFVWLILFCVETSNETLDREAKRRKEAYEKAINDEVTKRIQAFQKAAREHENHQNKIKKQKLKEDEEHARLQKERLWREEFERKLEAEFRQPQEPADNVKNALNEFI